ncbi:type IV pilus assembly protein PilE [Nitrosomonas aestuarii]|uniref:Type IV pilus assembly protein PilE n=1 Tax=Nitrosomonas aestuarii TaxID=52441 RepID=A0A1I4F9G9_9PROT|nr:type IV pilin protein [Nitrosomonas aestuarii]SFL13517.1 type IV pilus assembly protein PilE [Nitrosomonas aestuarii]
MQPSFFKRPFVQYGFTLIELMITVAIVGILATIAYPSYTQYVIRTHRVAAQSEMMAISNRQQQFLLTNRSYVDKTILEASGYALPADVANKYNYAITLGGGAVPFFTLTFTPVGSQSNDGNLTINSDGVKTPAEKW